MAKIVLSDDAPETEVRFSLGNVEFTAPYESDDAGVIANAEAHPWLEVEHPEVDELSVAVDPFPQVKPEDDALAAQNSVANDPEAVKAALRERAESDPVAIDAGLDQGKVVTTAGGVAETIAADDASEAAVKRATTRAKKENEEND